MGKSSDKKSAFGLSAEQIARLLSIGSKDGPGVVPPEDGAVAVQGTPASTPIERSQSGSDLAPRIEGYELIEKVAEAGQGQVWRALHLSTNRNVAIKVPRTRSMVSERAQLRFEREIELAARLNHPNIARIHDSGINRGQYYYVMDFIEGQTLDEYVRQKKLTHREILKLMRTICQAVQHAHQNGVIHRDLKPSNILVDEEGRPYIVDFGLAKVLTEEQYSLAVSMDGETIGTPAYMSPEQASGHTDGVDTRTDVYSLGVILFCLLTGQSPHDLTGSRQEVLQRIVLGQITRPRHVCPEMDRELEWLLFKALAPDPNRRYSSAGGLADDIDRYLGGIPLIAGPPGAAYRIKKFVKRNRTWVAAILMVSLTVAIGTAVSLVMYVRANTRVQRSRAVSSFVNDSVLAALTPDTAQGREITPISILDTVSAALEGKFQDSPLIEAELRHRLGAVYLDQCTEGPAVRHLERALEIRRRVLRNHDPLTISSMLLLGQAYGRRGCFVEAEPLLLEAVAEGTQQLGEDRDITLQAMLALGFNYEAVERYEDALRLYEKVLERTRHKGIDGYRLARWAMSSIGIWHLGHSRLDEGETWLKQAVDLSRRMAPRGGPAQAVFMGSLGLTYVWLGRYTEAEPLLIVSATYCNQFLGRNHWLTLQSLERLVYLYIVWDNPAKAAQWLAKLEASRPIDPLGLSGRMVCNETDGVYSMRGCGSDIQGLFDAFRFAHKELRGDGSITARIDTVEDVHAWATAGVTIRSTLDPAAEHASVFVRPTGVVAFRHRRVKGGLALVGSSCARPLGFPHWVRLTRRGSSFMPEHSSDGAHWEAVESGVPNHTCPVEIAMDETVHVGLIATSHDAGRVAEAQISEVRVTGNTDPTGPFTKSEDINLKTLLSSLNGNRQPTAPDSLEAAGEPTPSQLAVLALQRGGSLGSVRYEEATDTYTVVGAGGRIGRTSDEFHFAHRQLAGNGSIVARIDAIEAVNPWTKAGVMIRNGLASDCEYAAVLITPNNRICFQYRMSAGQGTSNIRTDTMAVTLPHWIRLIHEGNVFKGQHSPDGVHWTDIRGTHSPGSTATTWPATTEIVMKETTYVGLAVTSHAGSETAEAKMSHVTVTGDVSPPGEFRLSEDIGFQMIMLPKK